MSERSVLARSTRASGIIKERITLYLDVDIADCLWQERADTRENVSQIANRIFRDHYNPPPKATRTKPKPKAKVKVKRTRALSTR